MKHFNEKSIFNLKTNI